MEVTTKGLTFAALALGLTAVAYIFKGESDDPLTEKNTPECKAYAAARKLPKGFDKLARYQIDPLDAAKTAGDPDFLRHACEQSIESPAPK